MLSKYKRRNTRKPNPCRTLVSHRYLWILWCIFILTLMIWIPIHSSEMKIRDNSSKMVGGPCEYKEYKGTAEIMSIQKIIKNEASDTNKKYADSYNITFKFYPDENIQETFVNTKEREFILTLSNSTYPDLCFIQKNGIKVGKQLDCLLKVITKGFCTPVIFTFPALK